jgi:hypothetical protein
LTTPSWLTALQVKAARLFFSLPESAGFAVAGGAALIARGLIQRPTRDIDLFLLDAASSSVTAAAASFETAMSSHGWSHRRVIDQLEFVRFLISDDAEALIIDLGRDSPADEPGSNTELGHTLGSHDLAARKTLALFGRAEPRDFADVYDLAKRYGRDALLEWAAASDSGFDQQVFAEMLATLNRLTDEDLPVDARQAPLLRTFFRQWASELTRQ